MIHIPLFWQYQVILATHFVADFLLQTHWQASNKSKSNAALFEHVAVYTVVMGVVSGFLLGFGAMWYVFVWFTAVTHFGTDYVTSRWSSSYFRWAINDVCNAAVRRYRCEPVAADRIRLSLPDDGHWHNFFGVIGFDQLIHQATLGVTLWVVMG